MIHKKEEARFGGNRNELMTNKLIERYSTIVDIALNAFLL